MTRISVIIPTLNEAARIEGCVASIRAQDSDADIIVADGGSTDGTLDRLHGLATAIESPRGRGAQMNAGARVATGGILLFLHADSTVHPNGLAAMRTAMSAPAVLGGTFTLRFDTETPLLRAYALCTHLPLGMFRYGDQGVFVRRATFDALGGYRDTPLMEDVDFIARLRRLGRTVLVDAPVTTSARRFARHGVVRQQLLNAMLVGLYTCGVPPQRLARWYENTHR